MTLPLTPAIVRAAYDFLNETPPFNRWNLPDGDDIRFKVARYQTAHGWLTTGRKHKRPLLVVSSAMVGHTSSLLAVMAHELVHLHQYMAKMEQSHGDGFRKLAAQVCKVHGFDPKAF